MLQTAAGAVRVAGGAVPGLRAAAADDSADSAAAGAGFAAAAQPRGRLRAVSRGQRLAVAGRRRGGRLRVHGHGQEPAALGAVHGPGGVAAPPPDARRPPPGRRLPRAHGWPRAFPQRGRHQHLPDYRRRHVNAIRFIYHLFY